MSRSDQTPIRPRKPNDSGPAPAPAAEPAVLPELTVQVRVLREIALGNGDFLEAGSIHELAQDLADKLVSTGRAERVRQVPVIFCGPSPVITSKAHPGGRSYNRGERAILDPERAGDLIKRRLAMPIAELNAGVDLETLPSDPRDYVDHERDAPKVRVRAMSAVPIGGLPGGWGKRGHGGYVPQKTGDVLEIPEPFALRGLAMHQCSLIAPANTSQLSPNGRRYWEKIKDLPCLYGVEVVTKYGEIKDDSNQPTRPADHHGRQEQPAAAARAGVV